MKSNETIYPPSVEEKLNLIVEEARNMNCLMPLRDDAVRKIFGDLLMQHWLTGEDECELSTEDVFFLFKKAAAMTLIDNLIDDGIVDQIESDEGDILFLTEKGKNLYNTQSANINEIF